jgi:outer membrane receptor for ferrienterochelin and colicin
MNNKSQIFKYSILSFAVLGVLSSTASADDAQAANEEADMERIMVTASKRPKGLQESPVAVSVVSLQ